MMGNTKKSAIRWALALVSTIGASALLACSSPADPGDGVKSSQRVLYENSEMGQVVKNAIEAYPEALPPGVEWFHEVPEQLKQPNTRYEAGVADGVVAFYWLCAWEKSYLEALNRGDESVRLKSIGMIEKFPDSPWYKSSVIDPEGGWIKDVVTPAKLGDPTGIKREFISSCAQFAL